jgi:predicted nucleotidyltransferase
MEKNSLHFDLANSITSQFAGIPNVTAVGLGGSSAVGTANKNSDIDLYVFTTDLISLETREFIMEKRGATRADLNLQFWDLGDEWIDLLTGIEVDIIYWDTRWIEDQIDRVLVHQQASMGYTTCHWHTIKYVVPIFDIDGWLSKLITKCQQPYPRALTKAIIAKNLPVLREVIPSYTNQIEKALQRKDLVSLNHRVAALFASYFDILFAINRIPHPGEKRLVNLTLKMCEIIPVRMANQIEQIIQYSATGHTNLIGVLNELIDNLENEIDS